MRRLIGALGVLAILFILAVVGDRVAAGLAANRAEQQLVTRGFVSPEVTIRGFPFITQLWSGEYRHVDVAAAEVQTAAGSARRLTATLRGVRVDSIRAPRSAMARALSARGTVPYLEVEKAANVPGLKVTQGNGGEVRLTGELQLLGERYTVEARGRIFARGDHIRIVPTGLAVEGVGELDERLSSVIGERLAVDYAIPSLPRGLSVRSITPAATGFVVEVTGTNIDLRPRMSSLGRSLNRYAAKVVCQRRKDGCGGRGGTAAECGVSPGRCG